MNSRIFTRNNYHTVRGWDEYVKVTPTRAVRIYGPFDVQTREGRVSCSDGYLAIDSHGWPYPIAAEEFAAIYRLTSEKA